MEEQKLSSEQIENIWAWFDDVQIAKPSRAQINKIAPAFQYALPAAPAEQPAPAPAKGDDALLEELSSLLANMQGYRVPTEVQRGNAVEVLAIVRAHDAKRSEAEPMTEAEWLKLSNSVSNLNRATRSAADVMLKGRADKVKALEAEVERLKETQANHDWWVKTANEQALEIKGHAGKINGMEEKLQKTAQELLDANIAWASVKEELAALKAAFLESDSHGFENFHRNLCERFGYPHDLTHWRRDLASLEEYIAGELKAAQSGMVRLEDVRKVARHFSWSDAAIETLIYDLSRLRLEPKTPEERVQLVPAITLPGYSFFVLDGEQVGCSSVPDEIAELARLGKIAQLKEAK